MGAFSQELEGELEIVETLFGHSYGEAFVEWALVVTQTTNELIRIGTDVTCLNVSLANSAKKTGCADGNSPKTVYGIIKY